MIDKGSMMEIAVACALWSCNLYKKTKDVTKITPPPEPKSPFTRPAPNPIA